MRNRVEVLREVGIDDVSAASAKRLLHRRYRLLRAAPSPASIHLSSEVRLENRRQHELRRRLRDAVSYRRNPERAFTATGLGDVDPPNRRGLILTRTQVFLQPSQPVRQPARLDLLERDAVDAGFTAVRFRERV